MTDGDVVISRVMLPAYSRELQDPDLLGAACLNLDVRVTADDDAARFIKPEFSLSLRQDSNPRHPHYK